jgi:hypothetical protein
MPHLFAPPNSGNSMDDDLVDENGATVVSDLKFLGQTEITIETQTKKVSASLHARASILVKFGHVDMLVPSAPLSSWLPRCTMCRVGVQIHNLGNSTRGNSVWSFSNTHKGRDTLPVILPLHPTTSELPKVNSNAHVLKQSISDNTLVEQ